MDPLMPLLLLFEDTPSLDTLSGDPDRRFSELEEHIHAIEPRVRRRHEHIDALRAALRKEEKRIFGSFGVEHEYMDGPALEPRYAQFQLLHVPSGRAVIYSGDARVLCQIDEMTRSELSEDLARFEIYLADAMRWMRCLMEFREDLGIRYVSITTVGKENPNDSNAEVYTVGRTQGIAVTIVDMRLGSARAAGMQEDVTREGFFSEQVQEQLRMTHEGCAHNTYILTHPSSVLDHYQLGLMSGRILQGRWLSLHPESVN